MSIIRGWHRSWPYNRWPDEPFELNRNSPQAEGLVAWWPPLGSRGAGKLLDYGGRGNVATHYSTVVGQPDSRFGWGLDLQSTAAQLRPTSDIVLADNTPWTVALWCKTASDISVTYRGIYGNRYTSGKYTRFLTWQDDLGTLKLYNDSNNLLGTWSSVLQNSTYYHIALVCDGTNANNLKLYVDGINRGTKTAANISPQTIAILGSYSPTSGSWYAPIFDFRICRAALSSQVIWQMVHDKKWDLYKPLRRFWAVRGPVYVQRKESYAFVM